MAFAAMSSVLDTEALQPGAGQQPCEPSLEPATGAISTQALDVKLHPVFHIVEEPGGIRRLTEIEVPTEEAGVRAVAVVSERVGAIGFHVDDAARQRPGQDELHPRA